MLSATDALPNIVLTDNTNSLCMKQCVPKPTLGQLAFYPPLTHVISVELRAHEPEDDPERTLKDSVFFI